ncbi:hypothetical protein QTP86_009546 [Hemibagrus guttatus]|nr:hypothetical protein QTP86_009546 [Hemibagrus guttatus]
MAVVVNPGLDRSGPGRLAVINGTMNSAVYQKILKENVRPSVCDLKLKRTWVLQQDNDPKHTSKSTSEWLKKNKMKTLEWPSQSPDLNPIEMLWHDLKKVVHARKPSNVAELQQFCKDEWAKIPPQHCNRLIASYGKRLIAVVAAKGMEVVEEEEEEEDDDDDEACGDDASWPDERPSQGADLQGFYSGKVWVAGAPAHDRYPKHRKKVACTLQVGGEFLPQVEEFKYLGVLFTSEGRMDREIDRRIGAAAAVMRSMYRSVVVKKELSRKAKLSIYQLIYVPTLTYGHELWVMTERVRSRIQAAEMSFLRRVAGRSLRDRVRSSVTREELRVEPLLLHIERGQLRWLGHLFRMPPGRLPGEVFRACPTGKRPRGRPRTRWRDYVFRLAWERLGVPPEELEEVARERECVIAIRKI